MAAVGSGRGRVDRAYQSSVRLIYLSSETLYKRLALRYDLGINTFDTANVSISRFTTDS